MASVGYKLKTAILKGMEAVGKKAADMASNAQLKLNEIELEKRRLELVNIFPMKAMELWQNGTELPETLTDILKEIDEVDQQLTVLRAQKYMSIEGTDSKPEESTDVTPSSDEEILYAEEAFPEEEDETAEEPLPTDEAETEPSPETEEDGDTGEEPPEEAPSEDEE